jgi:hypothetical protein
MAAADFGQRYCGAAGGALLASLLPKCRKV